MTSRACSPCGSALKIDPSKTARSFSRKLSNSSSVQKNGSKRGPVSCWTRSRSPVFFCRSKPKILLSPTTIPSTSLSGHSYHDGTVLMVFWWGCESVYQHFEQFSSVALIVTTSTAVVASATAAVMTSCRVQLISRRHRLVPVGQSTTSPSNVRTAEESGEGGYESHAVPLDMFLRQKRHWPSNWHLSP